MCAARQSRNQMQEKLTAEYAKYAENRLPPGFSSVPAFQRWDRSQRTQVLEGRLKSVTSIVPLGLILRTVHTQR